MIYGMGSDDDMKVVCQCCGNTREASNDRPIFTLPACCAGLPEPVVLDESNWFTTLDARMSVPYG